MKDYDTSNPHWENSKSLLQWKTAANVAMKFIEEHVRIVGWEEIEAFKHVKEAMESANKSDSIRLKNTKIHSWQ